MPFQLKIKQQKNKENSQSFSKIEKFKSILDKVKLLKKCHLRKKLVRLSAKITR